MRMIAIAAVADSGAIGPGEDMLQYILADFRRFKAVTTGNTIIFGRRAYEQIGLLLNHCTIVVTRRPDWSTGDVEVTHPIEEAIWLVRTTPGKTRLIDGDGKIYAVARSYLTELDITHVRQELERAATFPVVASHE